MTSTTCRTGRTDRPDRPSGRRRLPGGEHRLEPAVRPLSAGDRVRPGDPGRGQRARLGAAERRRAAGAQRPALPRGLVQRRQRHRDRRQRAEVGDDRLGLEHGDRRRRAQPAGGGDRARQGRCRGDDRNRGHRRPGRRDARRRLRPPHPLPRHGLATTCSAAEIVVASGADGAKAINVDVQNNSDLLWALRGAGNGNFGIVTSLTYQVASADADRLRAPRPGQASATCRASSTPGSAAAPYTDNRLDDPARDPPRRDPAVRCSRGRVGGRGEEAAGADPVGRQPDCHR